MNITQRSSPNRNIGRQGWTPDIIACHITEGVFPGSIHWVTNPQSNVSYHYMVSRTGEVTQCVSIKDTAWANGTTSGAANNGSQHSRITAVRERNVNANLFTVSIGFEGRLNEKQGDLAAAQLVAAVNLIAHIRAEVKRIWGITIPFDHESIVGHADIVPRWKPNCPGSRFPFDEMIRRLNALEPPVSNEQTMKFNVKGEIIHIPAFIRNDRTYVQARPLLEALGYTVDWDDGARMPVIGLAVH